MESSAIESALEGGNGSEAPVPLFSKPDYGLTVMPWGRHKGQQFMNIAPCHLRSTFRWITEDAGRAQRFSELAEAIRQFLNQA